MKIYLVRHGEAVPGHSDPERPLSQRGREQTEEMGTFLVKQKVVVEKIFHSKKRRAAQTAEILAQNLGALTEEKDKLMPDDNAGYWVNELKMFFAEMSGDLMIVGHMPFMGTLLSLLAGKEIWFEEAETVCLKSSDSGEWVVQFSAKPGNLDQE